MKRSTKENLTSLGASLGVILLIVGGAGMDSENLVIPAGILIVGLVLLMITAKEITKWEDDT